MWGQATEVRGVVLEYSGEPYVARIEQFRETGKIQA